MKRQLAANATGAIGYLWALLGWLWAAVLFLTSTRLLENLDREPIPSRYPTLDLPEITMPEPVSTALLLLVVAFMIGLSIYAFIKAPAEAVKQSSRVATKTASKIVANTSRNQPLPARKKRALTAKITIYIKLAATLLSTLIVGALAIFAADNMTLAPNLAILVAASISVAALISFAVQYLLAKLLKVPLDKLL